MASTVTPKGEVLRPLNTDIPGPAINLQGFSWGTVDAKVEQSQTDEESFRAVEPHFLKLEAQRAFVTPPTQPAKVETIKPVKVETNGKPVTAAPTAAPATAPVAAAALSSTAPGAPTPLDAQFQQQLGPAAAPSETSLWPLDQMQGAFAGNGFNTIWRPDGDILELNFTTEQITFGSQIGSIPNRGLNSQPMITLAGIPYLQTVQDVTNPRTGQGDNPVPTDIHFEPGMLLKVPGSKSPPTEASIVRMASIPHGTTIHAQGKAPPKVPNSRIGGSSGGPKFDKDNNIIDITPFDILKPGTTTKTFLGKPFQNNPFLATQEPQDKRNDRIPEDLTAFIAEKTPDGKPRIKSLSKEIINNPNLILGRAIDSQTIRETVTFKVSTSSSDLPSGGGIANIAFLQGQKPTGGVEATGQGANAHAASMESTFWIELVEYELTVPPLSNGKATATGPATVLLRPFMPDSTAPTPQFLVTTAPGTKYPTIKQTIKVLGVQIQYSQTVNLNFNGLTWPHVSVATLVPAGPQSVTTPLMSA